MRTVWDIIKSPVITEKALVAKEETQDRRQLLTFRVDRRATKPEIKTAVETIFQVKVDQVRTAQYHGQDGPARALRRSQAFLEESICDAEAGREAG